MNLGEQVRTARLHTHITLDEAAELIRNRYNVRLSGAYLSMIERNERTNLTTKLQNALIDFFCLNTPHIPDLIDILDQQELTVDGQPLSEEARADIKAIIQLVIKKKQK
ncbi:MAG: hypothetical protein E6713_00320 [Sporomusaceae bacterium]|nr:hypothetical protein [Sporomusaceae bacterium]